MSLQDFHNWVAPAAKYHKINGYTIELEGQTDQRDGYSSTIYFIKLNTTNKILHLAIKASMENQNLRSQIHLKEVCLKEIYLYDVVKKTFEQFLHQNGLNERITFMPKVYATYLTPINEILVFDNLRAQKYELWDGSSPLTSEHVGLVLKAYGKWHGLSVALKKQQPLKFQELIKNNVNMFSKVMTALKFVETMKIQFERCNQNFHLNLAFQSNDVEYALTEMYFEAPEHHVILHGDCWNNNFMFLHEKDIPKKVQILDWQLSGLGSPVFDLSHFIYCCADLNLNENIKDLLQVYYESFSQTLEKLNCSLNLFSFETLQQHWKRFSHFGLFVSCLSVPIGYLTQVPKMADIKNVDQLSEIFTLDQFDSRAIERLRNNFLHYHRNLYLN